VRIALGHGNLETTTRTAVVHGASLVAFPELCTTPYFCEAQNPQYFEPATGQTISRMALLANELGIVVVLPFAESDVTGRYNSAAVIDADGTLVGVYRKRHLPNEERECFQSGEGPAVFPTAAGRIGVAICWDRFFPDIWQDLVRERARLVVVPTASSDRPVNPGAANGVITAIVNRSEAPFPVAHK
jgi:beta-ureidopropionase